MTNNCPHLWQPVQTNTPETDSRDERWASFNPPITYQYSCSLCGHKLLHTIAAAGNCHECGAPLFKQIFAWTDGDVVRVKEFAPAERSKLIQDWKEQT